MSNRRSNRLVVGFDGSQASLTALQWAAAEAEVRGASVRAVSSYSMPAVMGLYDIGIAAATADERAALHSDTMAAMGAAVHEALGAHPGVGSDFIASDRRAEDVLVEESLDAELVVVGSSGAGAVSSFLLGSVAAAVMHRSACPVVVVPAKMHDPCRRVVVGCDGSEISDRAVTWAADEADRLGAELLVLHAWLSPYRLTNEGLLRGSDTAEVDAALVLERAEQIARERTTGPVVGKMVEEDAVKTLLRASAAADLVVLGSRGRGGLRSMVLGSVTLGTAARSSCPVVVVQ